MKSTSPASNPKPAIWEFAVSHEKRPDDDVRACGSIFYTDTAEEIHALAGRSGLEVKEVQADRLAIERDGAFAVRTCLYISETENSRALHEVMEGLRSTYGIDLAKDSLIPNRARYFFRIRKEREFEPQQIDGAPYLWLHADKFAIGTWLTPTDEEYAKGLYAVENDS
ncbi:MAG: hypothetical protein ACK5XN_13075, partial [Bacteroidota bacterium]